MPIFTALLAAATLVHSGGLSQTVGEAAGIDVPFRIGENAIIVDAKVNGRNVSLMFDTGFGGSVDVDESIDLGPATGKMTLRDFVGEMQASTVKLTNLNLGAKKINIQGLSEAVVSPPSNYSLAYNTHCDGLMGFEVIQNNVTEINYEKKKFVFYPSSVDISKRIPDNKRTFLAKLLPIGQNSLMISVDSPSGKKMALALDTGNAFYATTHKDVLERVGLWDAGRIAKYMSESGVASGTVDSWTYKMSSANVFTVPVKDSYWDVIDLPSSSAEGDGTVGYGFLSNFNITIDFARRRVWLENFTGKAANEMEGETGITAGYNRQIKKTEIIRVGPNTPGEDAGIKEDDLLLGVGNVDTVGMGYRRLRKLLRGPIGSKVTLVISRNGSLKRVEVVRKALINE